MSLIKHARRELELAGLFDNDADYGGAIALQVMELIEILAKQAHSGHSAMLTLELFNMLAHYRVLTPITSMPDEWIDRSEMSSTPLWQNARCSSCFSKDGGKTWYDLDEVVP